MCITFNVMQENAFLSTKSYWLVFPDILLKCYFNPIMPILNMNKCLK